VYLYKSAFVSPEQLFVTMGHEYIHVGINVSSYKLTNNFQEYIAYSWEQEQWLAFGKQVPNPISSIYKLFFPIIQNFKSIIIFNIMYFYHKMKIYFLIIGLLFISCNMKVKTIERKKSVNLIEHENNMKFIEVEDAMKILHHKSPDTFNYRIVIQ